MTDQNSVPSTWIIIYPGGDRSRIGVAEIVPTLDYERNDYTLAARKEFYNDKLGAEAYARALAKQYGLTLSPHIPLLLDDEAILEGADVEAALAAYHRAQDDRTKVDNTAANLRFLALALYTAGYGVDIDPQSDAGQDLLTCLLDAGEGRAFIPFDFRRAW